MFPPSNQHHFPCLKYQVLTFGPWKVHTVLHMHQAHSNTNMHLGSAGISNDYVIKAQSLFMLHCKTQWGPVKVKTGVWCLLVCIGDVTMQDQSEGRYRHRCPVSYLLPVLCLGLVASR